MYSEDMVKPKKTPGRPKKKRQGLSPKLKRLALFMPEVIDGTLTLKAAMLKAGYAESSSNQQSQAVGSLRNNGVMQEALRKAGVTEQSIATAVKDGMAATRFFSANFKLYEKPDFHARHAFVKTGAELLDAFPAKKIDATMSGPLTYDDFEPTPPQAKSPDEAKKMADDKINA
jgi:hypothetical protein